MKKISLAELGPVTLLKFQYICIPNRELKYCIENHQITQNVVC